MTKNRIVDVVSRITSSFPLRGPMRRFFASHVNVLYYHTLGEPTPYCDDCCSLEEFQTHLHLLRPFYSLATLDSVLDQVEENGRLPAKPLVALTFDVGLEIVRGGGLDLLNFYGVKATFFVTTACIDNNHLMWRHKLTALIKRTAAEDFLHQHNQLVPKFGYRKVTSIPEVRSESHRWSCSDQETIVDELWARLGMPPVKDYLEQYLPYFSNRQLATLLDQGHTVGLHTRTHPMCSLLGEEQIRKEIAEPAQWIKERYRPKRVLFSYPFGNRLKPTVEQNLRAEGCFDYAFGIGGLTQRPTPERYFLRVSGEKNLVRNLFGFPLWHRARSLFHGT